MLEQMQSVSTVSPAAGSRRSGERGFTLVEMMVVLVLIFLIVGITLPNIQRSIVRADLMGEVKKLRTSLMISRVHAVKNGRRVALQILEGDVEQEGGIIQAWIDDNADGSPVGEEIVKRWTVGHSTGNIITLAPDGAADRDLFALASGRGIAFLPNGTAIVHQDGDIGIGMGSVVIGDTKFNEIRLTINAGAGTVVQEMWDPIEDEWSPEMKFWRY